MLKMQAGDDVAVIAPASHQVRGAEGLIEAGCQRLSDWGLEVHLLCSPQKRHFYLAGDDAYRGDKLAQALTDPKFRAVFATRGGYGSLRLLPKLDTMTASDNRFFCGFSDLTALLFAVRQRFPGYESVHAPGIANLAFSGDSTEAEQNRQRLRQVLFESETLDVPVKTLKHGQASGPLIGGCLSVMQTLLATPWEPDLSGKILFLEDVSEKPYVIDRMLTQFLLSDRLDRANGIIFGEMHNCGDGKHELSAVIADSLRHLDCPVVSGFPAGHGPLNLAFRFGQNATIDTTQGRVSLT